MKKTVTFALGILVLTGVAAYLILSWRAAGELRLVNRGRLSSAALTAMALSPDGRHLAVGDGARFVGLMSVSGRRLWRYGLGLSPTHPTGAVAVSGGGRRLAAGGEDGQLYLFDRTAKPLSKQAIGGKITALGLSPGGHWLGVGTADGKVFVFKDMALVWQKAVPDPVGKLLLAKAGRRVLALSGGKLLVFGASGRQLWQAGGRDGRILDVAMAPSGSYVLTGSAKRLSLLSQGGKHLRDYRPQIRRLASLAVSSDGRHLAVADHGGDIVLFSGGGQVLARYKPPVSKAIHRLALAADSKRLVAASTTQLFVFDSGWTLRQLHRLRLLIRVASYSAAGAVLLALAVALVRRRTPGVELPAKPPIDWKEAA